MEEQEKLSQLENVFQCWCRKNFPSSLSKNRKIEVTRKGKVRRAKLNYLRGRVGKAAKIKEARNK